MKRGTCNIQATIVSWWVCKQLNAPLRNIVNPKRGVEIWLLNREISWNLMKIGPLSEALGCLVFQDSPSYKLLDVAKDHGQTILMVSQSIMIPVDIRWHVDLPTSFTVSSKRARKRFGRYGQMLTVMSSKKTGPPPALCSTTMLSWSSFERSGYVFCHGMHLKARQLHLKMTTKSGNNTTFDVPSNWTTKLFWMFTHQSLISQAQWPRKLELTFFWLYRN